MEAIADYKGHLLTHVQAHYRTGERELAIELAEALGYAVTDTKFPMNGGGALLALHPNTADQNLRNNVVYISQMAPEQEELEANLKRVVAQDKATANSLSKYRAMTHRYPFGAPHFAVRYASAEAVEQAAERLNGLSKKLGDRLRLRLFRPGEPDTVGNDPITGFLDQDVLCAGAFLMGQLIELQTQIEV